jgi:hypothetical protein
MTECSSTWKEEVIWKEGVSATLSVFVYMEGKSVCRTECSCLPGRKKCLQNSFLPGRQLNSVSAGQSVAVYLEESSPVEGRCFHRTVYCCLPGRKESLQN